MKKWAQGGQGAVEHGGEEGVPICQLITPSQVLSAPPPLPYFDILKNISYFRHGVFLVAKKATIRRYVHPSVLWSVARLVMLLLFGLLGVTYSRVSGLVLNASSHLYETKHQGRRQALTPLTF